jgi:hypothetical protein
MLGFDFYGCEIDKGYFDEQEKRFKNQCMNETMIRTAAGNKIAKQLVLI